MDSDAVMERVEDACSAALNLHILDIVVAGNVGVFRARGPARRHMQGPIKIDKKPRIAAKESRRVKRMRERARQARRADIPGDMAFKIVLLQTQPIIFLGDMIGGMLAQKYNIG